MIFKNYQGAICRTQKQRISLRRAFLNTFVICATALMLHACTAGVYITKHDPNTGVTTTTARTFSFGAGGASTRSTSTAPAPPVSAQAFSSPSSFVPNGYDPNDGYTNYNENYDDMNGPPAFIPYAYRVDRYRVGPWRSNPYYEQPLSTSYFGGLASPNGYPFFNYYIGQNFNGGFSGRGWVNWSSGYQKGWGGWGSSRGWHPRHP
jgi:hypothetical protein